MMAPVLLAAAMATAQTSTPPAQNPAPAPQASSTSASQAGAAQAGVPPSPGHKVLQAKSQEEMKAYQDAAAKTDPAAVEAAADDFAAKYPNSELRASLYIRAMNMFAQANNNEKVIITGRLAIAADPTNPIPLVQVANVLSETTRDNDMDREQRLAEAAKDAHAAIDNIDTGLMIPANADPQRVAGAKLMILTMAYDTLGMIDMNKGDFASAQKNLQMAIDQNKANPEAVLYLRLSVAQDKLKNYTQALDSANKAVQYAKDGTPAQNLAKQQQARLQKLISAGPGAENAAPAAAPSPMPAPAQAPMPSSPNTPR
jgi:tetratricopeptide (TPR) repeat protein